MSLQFVLGNSGAGKSHGIYKKILEESQKYPERNYLVIVPEQFTMQTQKQLVELSPSHGLLTVDILSFQRLAYRVLEKTGGMKYPVLEEIGKTLVLQRVIQEKGKGLGVLSGSLKKTGMVNEMKSLVSELMQYDISPKQVEELLEKSEEKPLLSCKLQDVRIIYQGFIDYLKERYITEEEILDLVCERIALSNILKNCQVVFDGFTGFTPVQNKLLRKILKLAQKVWVTITADSRVSRERMKSPQNLFHMSGRMMEQLEQLAQEEHVEILEDLWVTQGKNSRFAEAPALHHLEQQLFRYGNHPYTEKQEEIQVITALNPKEEVEEIARRIRYLVRSKEYQYGEISVITGDLETYGSYARQVMEDYQIPYFLDEKHSILMNPFVEFIRATVSMVVEDFTYESVFRYLRCGLSCFTIDEVDMLENYILAVGIRGWKQWNQVWGRMYHHMQEQELAQMNELRERFLKETSGFVTVIAEKKLMIKERTRYLYEFIVRCGIQEQLKEKEAYFKSIGKSDLEKEYGQIYGIIIELLDKMVQILGEEQVTMEEYQQILEAGFLESSVGIIPPSADQVLIGDMERTRLKDIKVLFFAGMNDSVIPKKNGTGGVLSEADREFLKEQKISLAPTARESMYIQKFYLYLNMTKPKEKLYLSYSRASKEGQMAGPAFLISAICKMFPDIVIQEAAPMEFSGLEKPKQAVACLLQGMQQSLDQEPDEKWKELFTWFLNSKEWEEKCREWMSQVFLHKADDYIGKSIARVLYGTTLDNSATELERFAACGFAHFLQYGLQITEREKYEFRSADMGNILHQALEQFSENLKKKHLTWRELTKESREQMIDECVDQITSFYGNTILESSARNQYMIKRVKRILRRTVWAVQEQIKVGKFEPDRFEISFAMEENLEAVNFQLSEDESLHLRGRIDRVDRYEEEDTVYVKVIDYKSGETSLDLIALYYGLQLQLVVYMNGALELEQKACPDKKVEPAGIFYYRVKDPVTEGNLQEDEESISKRILQELKVNGLVREEKKVIHDLDETLEAGGKSSVIPVAYNKNGSISKNSQTASLEQFQILSEYVNRKIKNIGIDILNGNVKRNPYKYRNRTACDFCAYKEICGFDEKNPEYRYRRLTPFSSDDLWEQLKGKEES